MPISYIEGSHTVDTEWSLAADSAGPTSQTNDYVLQAWLDLSALQAGDQFKCTLYEKIQTTGTQRVVEEWIFSGTQAKPGWVMPSVIVLNGWDVTLVRTAGTARLIEWSLRTIS